MPLCDCKQREMVNHGPSRACTECKKRRKKCDQARPSCSRCVKSRRPCPGYGDDSSLVFRHYHPFMNAASVETGRCSPGILSIWEDAAIQIFLDNLVVPSQNRQKSRGFLHGIQSLFTSAAPGSALLVAAKVVALAAISNTTRSPELASVVQTLYGCALRDLNMSLPSNNSTVPVEFFLTALLLGLYEIISSSYASPAKHIVHVRGIVSFIHKGIHFSNKTSKIQSHSPGSPLILKSEGMYRQTVLGVFCPPVNDRPRRSLDLIIIKLSSLTERIQRLLNQGSPPLDELAQLQGSFLDLEDEISGWDSDRPPEWTPSQAGFGWVNQDHADNCSVPYCSTGPVEEYLDYYVATAWNSWRAIYVLYLDHMANLTKAMGHEECIPIYAKKAQDLVHGLKASVPYFLSQSLQGYMQHLNTGLPPVHSNRVIRGLLLMHPLYVMAKCEIVSSLDKEYLIENLKWIGTNLGVGQAIILADYLQPDALRTRADQASELPLMDVLEGYYLLSGAMMLELS
ncbi:unnamed protein product [Clonostachys rosea]|uniref:Zn(2)-C6 fungal-type domain-containing protein n=1 Tax=Bionectria ochroleuca TaxID=29856 RepID=A0ABY6UZE4_BIOOC|nr:unnamed protein product [Clonostachys rosea]